MELLAKFDENNYEDTTAVLEKYTVRGIILRDGKLAMQRSRKGIYKLPGGGPEAEESYLTALCREVREETGLFVKPESVLELGEILELRRDIYDKNRKYICHTLFYYCQVEDRQVPIQLTPSEAEKGFEMVWAPPEEICRCNSRAVDSPWILRDTEFVKMLLDGRILLPEQQLDK